MDIAKYSADARAAIKNAREVASAFRHPEIGIEHLLIAVIRLEGSEVESMLNQLGKSPAFVESVIETYLKDQPSRSSVKDNVMVAPSTQAVLQKAIEEKDRLFDPLVEPEHIFIAAFDPTCKLSGYVREQLDITRESLYKAIAETSSIEELAGAKPDGAAAEGGEATGKKKVSETLRYCIDLTNQAAAGEFDPCIGRDEEVRQVIQILLRRRKNSPVLVGGAGVGKTAIVEGFAQAVVDEAVPKVLHGIKVMEVDMGGMVAGAKYKGEFEERFKALISDVVKSAGRVVLFIDEIHMLMGAGGGGGGMDAANLIKPALARGQIRVIGATTQEEYTKYIEKDKAMERRFEKVKIDAPDFNSCVRIIKGVIGKYEKHHNLTYTPEAITSSVKFALRYLSDRNLPDIALDVVDEAASEFSVKEEFAGTAVAAIPEKITTLEKLLAECEGKDPSTDPAAFDSLYETYDDFARQVDRLNDFWGHRLEVKTGGDA